jgi:hypothetical protein
MVWWQLYVYRCIRRSEGPQEPFDEEENAEAVDEHQRRRSSTSGSVKSTHSGKS